MTTTDFGSGYLLQNGHSSSINEQLEKTYEPPHVGELLYLWTNEPRSLGRTDFIAVLHV